MNYIERVLQLLDLNINETFHIRKCVDVDGRPIKYKIDGQGHVLYQTPESNSWLNSKMFTLTKILNGTALIDRERTK